jgi:hypothetical protein
MNPSHAPVGLFMNVCHCSSAWRPFIRDPSYPLADAEIYVRKVIRDFCERVIHTEHDKRQDAEVEFQEMAPLVPWLRIL